MSSQHAVIQEFQTQFVEQQLFTLDTTFPELVLQINKNEPTPEFAENYLASLNTFFDAVYAYRNGVVVN
ncbi:hypothetical protein D3C81_2300860 [compost metagenome]